MGVAQGFSAASNARAQRESLRQQKEARDQELARMGYSFDGGKMSVRPDSAAEAEQLEAKEAVQLAKALQGKLSAQDTDRAFEDFAYTGDANYLQNALNNNQQLKQAWGQRGVQQISNIDFANDTDLLSRNGFTETAYDTDEKKDIIRKNAYKIYNGKDWSLGLANKAVAETGAMTRMGKRRAEPILQNHEQLVSLLSGPKISPFTAEGHKYEKEIMAAAEETGVPPNLIAAQIHQESRGNPNARSPKGAEGLMQLMPDTAKEVGVTNVRDPAQNILGGARYLAKMLDKYQGDVPVALAAYNAGPGNVDKHGGIPPFGETQQYVSKILAGLDEGESYYGSSADGIINTILEHRRAKANAEKGTTSANVDQEIRNQNRQLDQADRKLDQEDTSLKIDLLKLEDSKKTTEEKELDAADSITEDLMDRYGGEEEFFKADFSNEKDYNKAYRDVVKIEQLTNTAPSEADKKEYTDLRTLISLSEDVSKLTIDETGLIDKNLGDLKQYFDNNVQGAAAKSAWAAFRNIYVHTLSGSALTPQEAARNAEALGSLGKQLGPALEMFQQSLNQVGSRLDSASRNLLPVSAKVRLGADKDKLAKVKANIDNTISYIQGLDPNSVKSKQDANKTLDAIFKGSN